MIARLDGRVNIISNHQGKKPVVSEHVFNKRTLTDLVFSSPSLTEPVTNQVLTNNLKDLKFSNLTTNVGRYSNNLYGDVTKLARPKPTATYQSQARHNKTFASKNVTLQDIDFCSPTGKRSVRPKAAHYRNRARSIMVARAVHL